MLDHIELIGQLGDMADVPPTSHVIDVENALREDEPRPSMPVERALESAPDAAPGRVPGPEPGGVMIELTAKQAADAIKAGDLDAGEYFELLPRSARPRTSSTRTSGSPTRRRRPTAARSRGVPIAIKDLFCTEGIPSQAGSKILEDYRPPYTATSVAPPLRGRRDAARQDQPGRVRDGLVDRELRLRPDAEPVGHAPAFPAARAAARASSVAAGTAPWSIGTDTGGSIRQPAALCGIVGMKPTYGAISRYGMIAFASSLDQAGPFTRDVTDCALLLSAMVGADPCDSTSIGLPEPITLPTATDLKGIRLGVPEELTGEGIEPGVMAAFEDTLEQGARARRDGRDDAPAALPARPRRLLPDRARGVQLQPRPLRRRPLRAARRGAGRPARHVHGDPRGRASAPRSSGAC